MLFSSYVGKRHFPRITAFHENAPRNHWQTIEQNGNIALQYDGMASYRVCDGFGSVSFGRWLTAKRHMNKLVHAATRL